MGRKTGGRRGDVHSGLAVGDDGNQASVRSTTQRSKPLLCGVLRLARRGRMTQAPMRFGVIHAVALHDFGPAPAARRGHERAPGSTKGVRAG